MCEILLSINPEHVENIFNGKKIYEYRKTSAKRKIDKIYIYCTHPVKKIVGVVDVDDVIEDKPEIVWEITKKGSGTSKEFFDEYYKNSTKAVAYKLSNIQKFSTPKELSDYGISNAPQSFIYMNSIQPNR